VLTQHPSFTFRLEIKQSSEGYHHVPGLVEAKVENIKEVWDVLLAGSNARAVGSNNVNEHSSRSHWSVTVFIIISYYFLYHELIACCPIGSFRLLTLLQHAMHHGEG